MSVEGKGKREEKRGNWSLESGEQQRAVVYLVGFLPLPLRRARSRSKYATTGGRCRSEIAGFHFLPWPEGTGPVFRVLATKVLYLYPTPTSPPLRRYYSVLSPHFLIFPRPDLQPDSPNACRVDFPRPRGNCHKSLMLIYSLGTLRCRFFRSSHGFSASSSIYLIYLSPTPPSLAHPPYPLFGPSPSDPRHPGKTRTIHAYTYSNRFSLYLSPHVVHYSSSKHQLTRVRRSLP